MTPVEYLNEILKMQSFPAGSEELEEIKTHRDKVNNLLQGAFGSTPHIIYGGSHAKRTMIRESYDVDILCYFPHDSDVGGNTLQAIFENVAEALSGEYFISPKRSALRLMSILENTSYTHLDVVPGRYTKQDNSDVNLYQHNGEKERLKTNPEIHIDYIKKCEVRKAIKLMKLWNIRYIANVKTFVLELLVVDLLAEKKDESLAEQLLYLWETFRDEVDSLTVIDPANSNNDLSSIFDDSIKARMSEVAVNTLSNIEQFGWESVFGEVESDESETREVLSSIAVSTSGRISKPWSSYE